MYLFSVNATYIAEVMYFLASTPCPFLKSALFLFFFLTFYFLVTSVKNDTARLF